MSLNKEDVIKIAKLARIGLRDGDIDVFTRELSQILTMINELQQVDTSSITPTTSVVDKALPMREDIVSDGGYPEDIVKNAPEHEFNCFKVPKVIE